MDSLTQIVLGAAVGEVALGRKIGNRALMWGAIGGTIPDLDVMANLFMDPLNAMCVHRGITHSIFFSVVAPLAFAWLLTWLYNTGMYRSKVYKWLIAGLNTVLLAGIVFGLYRVSDSLYVHIISVGFAGFLIFRLYTRYIRSPLTQVEVSYREWYVLFFLAFFTHIALDCFTAYGTQIFLPFSNERVAFNTVSVADPLYTVPFLICVIITAFARRGSRLRHNANLTGIVISSLYLAMTVANHFRIHRVFDRALESRSIETTRQIVNPVILQNVLWNCVAEGDSAFYVGLYSMFDSNPNMHLVNTLPKHPEAVAKIDGTKEYEALYWFSDGFLQVIDRDTVFELFDLRFGPMRDTINRGSDFVFRFELVPEGDELHFRQVEERPDDMGEAFQDFVQRVKGH